MKSNPKWSEKQGRQVVRAWRRSGLSLSVFARGRGCSSQRIQYWRGQVEGEGRPVAGAGARIIPGIVVGSEGYGHEQVSVVLPRGVVVEARSVGAVDPEWLARVVRRLEEDG